MCSSFQNQSSVIKNKNKFISKLESEHNAIKAINAAKLNKMKRKHVEQKNEILKDRDKWQGKLDALNDELDKALIVCTVKREGEENQYTNKSTRLLQV